MKNTPNSVVKPTASPKILHLEDSAMDAELIQSNLQNKWPDCSIQLVSSFEEFKEALDRKNFDIILSDCSMPFISGMEALALARQCCPEKRFIFVSGHIGEDNAIEALKVGATDYVLKDRLSRLTQAVERAWNETLQSSKRVEAEQALKESEHRFRTLVEQSLVGIYVIGQNHFIYANNALADLLGYTVDDLLQRPLLDFIAPADRAKVSENVRKRLSGIQKTMRYELRMLKRDGSIAWVEVHGSQVTFGGQAAIIGTLLDLTERAKAEETVRKQAAYLDNAHDAIYVRDLEQNIVYWNSGASRLYGWEKNEVMGQKASNLLYRKPSPQLDQIRKEVLERGEWVGELRQVTKEGKDIVVQSRRTLMKDANGNPISILNINTDITEQKKIETQFLRIQRLESIGTLAGGVAHDLNNLIAPILMGIEMLRLKTTPQERALLDTMQMSAERGANLVRQILTFSRGDEGIRKEVQLSHLVRDQIKISQDTFPRSISVKSSCASGLWTTYGDPTQLYQVIMNLCVNARDAMPDGGELKISVNNVLIDSDTAKLHIEATPGPYVLLSVSDTGTGIPPEILNKIFDPFFTTKEITKGTGLGLSTTLGIVKSHNGFLTVYSEVGRGTDFKVYLPAHTSHQKSDAVTMEPSNFRANGELVMVVDDELAIREMTCRILTTYGFNCVAAENGEEALAVFGANRETLQIAIVDTSMPLMDGPATIRALKRMKQGLKVLAVSGIASNSKKVEELADSSIRFIQKPYTGQKLIEAIQGWAGLNIL